MFSFVREKMTVSTDVNFGGCMELIELYRCLGGECEIFFITNLKLNNYGKM